MELRPSHFVITLFLVGCFLPPGEGQGSQTAVEIVNKEIRAIKSILFVLVQRMRGYDTQLLTMHKEVKNLGKIRRQKLLNRFQESQAAKFQAYLDDLKKLTANNRTGVVNFNNKQHEDQIKKNGELIAALQKKLEVIVAAIKANTDTNECTDAVKKHDCDTNADCINTVGSFTCKCKDGFKGSGKQCTDINECTDPAYKHDCDNNADCTNNDGSFTCKCKVGFKGNGKQCTDINECTDPVNKHDCDKNADCTNTVGSFTCKCKDGFKGNGKQCTDINECTGPAHKHDCDTNADCTNTDGGYTCKCKDGFKGNGKQCTGQCSSNVQAFKTPKDISKRGTTQGSFGEDPSSGKVYYMNGYSNVRSLSMYPNMANFVSNTNVRNYPLAKGCYGSQSQVINNKLYCQDYSGPNVLVYDLNNINTYHTITLPGAAHRGQCPYGWGGYSDIDIAYDGESVYILWAKSTDCKFIISKITKDNKIERTWNTGVSKRGTGQAFIICGKMYVVSTYAKTATVSVIYDLSSSKTTSGNGLTFTSGHGYNSHTHYDPVKEVLYSWDHGYQVMIDVSFKQSQSGQCTSTVQAFKTPKDISKRGTTQGSFGEDPSTGKVYYMNGYSNVRSLSMYPNMANYVSNTNVRNYPLAKGCYGAQAQVINNKLYCQDYSGPNVLVYDLNNINTYRTIALPGAAHRSQCYYGWGGYSDIDIAYDGQNVNILWAKPGECKFIISKITKDNKIERTWNTGISKRGTGQAFIICGKMYVVKAYQKITSISYIYDLSTSQTTSSGLAFSSGHGYNSHTHYDPVKEVLYSWDHGYQVMIDVSFKQSQSGQCSSDVLSFKSPIDKSKRGVTQGSFGEDPSTAKVYYMNGYNNVRSLSMYPNMANYVSNTNVRNYPLAKGCYGSQSQVISDKLYCQDINSPNVLVYDLNNINTHRTIALPGAAHRGQCPYGWGGYSDIDIAYDGESVYILWAKTTDCKFIISKIDKDNKIERTWNTGISKRSTGQAFIICGKMYVVKEYHKTTSISYIYDLRTSQTTTPSGLAFSSGHNYNSNTHYNPKEKVLYSWDHGYQVVIGVNFK